MNRGGGRTPGRIAFEYRLYYHPVVGKKIKRKKTKKVTS